MKSLVKFPPPLQSRKLYILCSDRSPKYLPCVIIFLMTAWLKFDG